MDEAMEEGGNRGGESGECSWPLVRNEQFCSFFWHTYGFVHHKLPITCMFLSLWMQWMQLTKLWTSRRMATPPPIVQVRRQLLHHTPQAKGGFRSGLVGRSLGWLYIVKQVD